MSWVLKRRSSKTWLGPDGHPTGERKAAAEFPTKGDARLWLLTHCPDFASAYAPVEVP